MNGLGSLAWSQKTAATCRAKLGRAPKPLPRWAGELLAKLLLRVGPKGLEFGKYSIEYHW